MKEQREYAEEKKEKKNSLFNKKRVLIVLAVFLLVAVMVFSNPEVRQFFLETKDLSISFQAGTGYDAFVYGKEMLLVNKDGIRAIDRKGRESWSVVMPNTAPVLDKADKYIMLADLNGTSINVYEKDKLISQIKTEREILSAKMNKYGYVAAATDELGYKGAVTVFDKNGNDIFKWSSGSGYIGDVDISSKKKLAVAQLMTDKEKVYSRVMLIDTGSDKDAKCIAEVDGIVMRLQYKDNGGLIAVTDSAVHGFKKNGKVDFKIDFGGRCLEGFNIENAGNMVFAFDGGLNNSVLESYSSRGKFRGSYETDGEMTAFDVNGECILAAGRNGIVRVAPSGKEKNRIEVSRDVKKIKIFPGRNEALLIGSASAEITKTK